LSEQLQLRSGTASQVASFTGASAECVVDTTNNRIVVNDGSTVGGWPAAKLVEVITNTRTAVSDAAYSALTTDRLIAYSALTAARTVTLCAAAAYPTGTRLLVVDETGNASATQSITVAAAGSDVIDGAGSAAINIGYGYIAIESNGSNAWTIVDRNAPPAAVTLNISANGAQIQSHILESIASPLSGASTNAATQIPANCILLGVSCRVTSAITVSGGTGTPGFEIGVSGNLSQFGSSLGLGLNDTNYGIIGPTGFYAPTTIVLTATASGGGSPTFTAGAVRLAIHYLSINPPAQ
jgi:hypothetical protein